jgi:hypothetical protein
VFLLRGTDASLYRILLGNSAILQKRAGITKILISDDEWLLEEPRLLAGTVPVQRDVFSVNCTVMYLSKKPSQTEPGGSACAV